MIRTIRAYVAIVGATIYTGGRVILYDLLFPRRFRRCADRFTGEWTSLCLRGAGTSLVVKNGERLRVGGARILVSNHESWFDIFAIGTALRRRFCFVGKKEVSRIPVVGHAWERVGHIAIDRSDREAAIASLERADRLLRDGRTIIMFPEGTRSSNGELGRFKKGAFVMAIRSQVPVLPVAVLGTRRIMRKGEWRIFPGTATVVVGNPVDTEGLTLRDRNRLARECRAEVARLMNGEGEPPCRPS